MYFKKMLLVICKLKKLRVFVVLDSSYKYTNVMYYKINNQMGIKLS